MYSIGQISKLTGITAFTLRYYEKIGLLPKPHLLDGKQNGVRRYDDQDLRFIRFIHGLKQTGMKLEDIAAFTEDGCLLNQKDQEIGDMHSNLGLLMLLRIQTN
jgi:DNA-binding transcriptional MerR regulator